MDALSSIYWVFTGLMFVLVVICVAIGRGKIPVNHFIGIRTPMLMRTPEAWRVGHSAAVVPAAIASGACLLFSLLGLLTTSAYWGTIVAFAAGVIWAFISASKAARAVNQV